jgi:hypothetical protein
MEILKDFLAENFLIKSKIYLLMLRMPWMPMNNRLILRRMFLVKRNYQTSIN